MQNNHNSIVYIPLDERPCNYIYPQYIAGIGGMPVLVPPKALLGHFKQPANVDALWGWLLEQAPRASHFVLSMDMLLYGGIVPSRLHHLPPEACEERLARLCALRKAAPGAKLYAFQLITRAPARNGSGEEPDYYEAHGYDIFRHGVLGDKKAQDTLTPEEETELSAILARVPGEHLADFLHRRKVNYQSNLSTLSLAAEGLIDHLVIPLDDCFTHGYAPAERRLLAARAAELGLGGKAAMYPGADEMGCTLVARAVCDAHSKQPRVWLEYSSKTGRTTTPRYEDRPICETAPHHIQCAGAVLAQAEAEADIALMIHPPTELSNRIKFEFDRRLPHEDAERQMEPFIQSIQQHLAAGRICGVADCAIPDGADEALMQRLQKENLLQTLTGYSGWNTSSNAMGTVAAQLIALYAGGGGERAQRLSEEFRLLRLVEDWAYMSHVRQDLLEAIEAGQYGQGLDNRYLGAQTRPLETEITGRLQAFAAKGLGKEIPTLKATLPWQRMFEIELEV